MEDQGNKIQDRNREIGHILQEARSHKRITVTICAQLIGTSRRRYTAMECGEAMIGAAELEILIDFLEIPRHKIWRVEGPDQILISVTPGKPLCVLLDVRDDTGVK